MKNTVKYGLMFGFIPAIIMFLVYAVGMHRDQSVQTYMQFISIAIVLVVIFLGIKAERDHVLNGFISFGKAFSTGFMIVLIGAVIGIAMTYLYFDVIDPGKRDFMIMLQEDALYDRGMSPEQIDQALPQIEKFMTLPMMIIFGFFGNLIIGSVITLICAAILKKENPNEMIG
jgi:Protein of unknown function (DUF4199)